MEEMVLEMPPSKTSDELSGAVTDRTTLVLARRAASLMTPLGLTTGDVLTEVDSSGAITLRRLIRKLDWPVYLVLMAVGALVRQGLIRATQRELEVVVESMPEWSGAAQAEVV
jgi:hypothetical protein